MRTALPRASAALALCVSLANAQQVTPAGNSQPQTTNPQMALPYGAREAKAVSRWTPDASHGRQLTLNDLLSWKQIRTPGVSNDGRWFAYILGPNEGDAEVVIRGTQAGAREWRFPVGDQAAALRAAGGGGGGGGGPQGGGAPAIGISGNSKWVAFLIYPSSATPRRGRGGPGGGSAADRPQPTKLGVVSLADGTKREFENVRAFRFAGDRSDWLAVHHAAPASTGGTGTGTGAGAGAAAQTGTMLELVNLGSTEPATPIANVTEFSFDDSADWMAYAVSVADQLGNSLQLRQLSTGITRSLDAQKANYRRLTWGDSSDALAALRVVSDTSSTATIDEQVTVVLWPRASLPSTRTVEITPTTNGISGGLVLSG